LLGEMELVLRQVKSAHGLGDGVRAWQAPAADHLPAVKHVGQGGRAQEAD
jgi:hypothetical protein